ncbi:MAG TPA: apolipoprotein N-acyltransferase [Gemmatimonadales bacterium]|nr:apolipoprotein N-acyltransferase [Gemmatimonadales bacterium]
MSSRRAAVLTAVGAILLAASYPPFPLPALSFVALAPAILLVQDALAARDARLAFRRGFWYGLAAQALVLYWMVVALWHFTPLSALGYLATITILALWTGALFWFTVRVRLAAPRVPLAVVFPVAWTAVEWAVGHQGDIRFPWLGLGTSLADAPVLVQWADLAGARGVTLWVAWANVMLVEGLAGKREGGTGKGAALVRYLAPVLGSIVLAAAYGAWRMRALPVRDLASVGLIQPNEGYHEKWERPGDSVVAKLLRLSRTLHHRAAPNLIVWPEAAVPYYLQLRPVWDSAIARFTRDAQSPLFTGGLYAVFRGPDDYDYFNAAFFVDASGAWRRYPVYGKHYLVPIVERVPFVPPEWFGNLRFFGGFSRGRELPVYATAFGRFGPLICYESAFEDLPRRYRRLGADFLVNITNDAWFGRTSAPYQHASHLVLRAIETRMGVARAANSGISEFVDPLGRVYAETGLETEAAVVDTLRTSDVMTLYVRLGDWVGLLCVVGTVVLGLWPLGRRVGIPRPGPGPGPGPGGEARS